MTLKTLADVRELMGHLAAATRPQGWTLSVAWKSIDVHCKKTGAKQWRIAARGNAVANVAVVRVADASLTATTPMPVIVIVMEVGLAAG
jgi:hypothetical protein